MENEINDIVATLEVGEIKIICRKIDACYYVVFIDGGITKDGYEQQVCGTIKAAMSVMADEATTYLAEI
jgi:hypothetical protein